MTKAGKNDETLIQEGKIFAVLSYLSILCIIPLLFKKDNDFVLSHGKQGLILFIAQVGFFIASIILGPLILKFGFFLSGVFSLWGIIEALRGNYIRIPLVADIAEKVTL